MKWAVYRLVLTSSLFVGWLGYLAFQVATLPETSKHWPLVLSRPQVLASPLDVIADVADESGKSTVVEVLYPEDAKLKAGDSIQVTNIAECRPLARTDPQLPPPPPDWSGPGRYLLPLRALPNGKYEVVSIPASPGFFFRSDDESPRLPRIYPDTPATRVQYRHIDKPNEVK